jgi:hypothetical protein
MHNRPNDTMGDVSLPEDVAHPIAVHDEVESWLPRVLSVPHAKPSVAREHFWGSREPKQVTGGRIVSQQLADQLGTDIYSGSHGALPRVRGQGRARQQPRFRPVSYGRFTICSQASVS